MKHLYRLVLLLATSGVSLFGQTPAMHYGQPALKFSYSDQKHAGAYFVEYLRYGDEPAFRIRAHHYHAWCNGYLYITPSKLVYDPAFSPNQKDGFAVNRPDVAELTPRFSGYQFAVGDREYKFAFLSDNQGPAESAEQNRRPELMKFIALAFSNFAGAQQFFLSKMAGMNVKLDSPPAALSVGPAPVINVLSPAGVMSNITVDSDTPAGIVIGAVAADSGISQVTVNGAPVKLTAISKQITLFQSGPTISLPGITQVTVNAAAMDGTQNAVTFRMTKPEVRILAPVPLSKTRDDKVNVKGMVLGMHDLKQIKLASKALPLTKRNDGGFDFELPGVPLNVGPNTISGYTERLNGQRSTFSFAVVRVPPVPSLTLDAIEKALRNSVSPVRLEALVDQQGVDFELNPEAEKRLRAAGATKSLLDAIADGQVVSQQH